MLCLGRPWAARALLCPGGRLRGARRSLAAGEERAAAAAAGSGRLLGVQVQPNPEIEPAPRHLSQRLVRLWSPAAAPQLCRRESRSLLLLLLPEPAAAAAGALQPRAEISMLRATGAGGGQESRSPGSRKDNSGSLGNGHIDPSQEDEKKPNKSQQLKKVFKEYGAVAVAFHVGISLMSLGMFYLAVSSGVDMTAILFKLGFDEALVQSKLAAGTSTFVLAYAVHKLFAPVRISITLVSVPFLVRYFRKIGFFKPPAPNP